MKTILFYFLFSLVIFSNTALGQQEASPAAEAFFQKAMRQINDKHISWIKKTALDVNNKNLNDRAVNDLAKNYGQISGLGEADILAVAFLVMMQASKSQQEDLKAIMDQVKSINAEKKKIRDAQKHFDDKKPITRQLLDSFKLIAKPGITFQPVRLQATQPVKPITPDTIKSVSTVSAKISDSEIVYVRDQLKDKKDSISEMSEMTNLRLQTQMDRYNKFMSTLSNILKKISSTQDTIVQNLK